MNMFTTTTQSTFLKTLITMLMVLMLFSSTMVFAGGGDRDRGDRDRGDRDRGGLSRVIDWVREAVTGRDINRDGRDIFGNDRDSDDFSAANRLFGSGGRNSWVDDRDGETSIAELNLAKATVSDHLTAARSIGNEDAYQAYINGLETDAEKMAAQAARGLVTGRSVEWTSTSLSVEKCSNGLGGDWFATVPTNSSTFIVDDPDDDPTSFVPAEQPPACNYFLANGRAGTLDLRSTGVTLPATINLSWQISGTNPITKTLSPGGSVTGSVSSVSLNNSTTFQLTGVNTEGSDSCSVTVLVDAPVSADPTIGCMDISASNYSVLAITDDGSCEYVGCMDVNADAGSYCSTCNVNDTSACIYTASPPTMNVGLAALADVPDAIFSSYSPRLVPDGTGLYFRWSGVLSNGTAADQCVGTTIPTAAHPTPFNFTDNADPTIANSPVGDTDPGGINNGLGVFPGLTVGDTLVFSVTCTSGGISGSTNVVLTGADNFSIITLVPPSLTVNGSVEREIFARKGEPVQLQWDPSDVNNVGCTLTPDVSGGANLDAADSVTVNAEGQTLYTYSCPGGSSEVTVTTLPSTQEI